jgi:hypothetical protein
MVSSVAQLPNGDTGGILVNTIEGDGDFDGLVIRVNNECSRSVGISIRSPFLTGQNINVIPI